jgi:mono/diheme cytochrome c family protein
MKRIKRFPFEYAVLATAVAAALLVAPAARAQTVAANAKQPDTVAEKTARGKYIVTTSGCHDCHTPWVMGEKGPEPDMTRALSGHPQDMVLPPPPKHEGPWIMTAAATNTAWAGPRGMQT